MTLLLAGAGFFTALALGLRELQLARERALSLAVQEQLRLGLEGARSHVLRLSEDLFVLHRVLVEHQLVEEGELARSRRRLVEGPRRRAEERDAIQRHLGRAGPAHAVLDDGDGKLH